MMARKLGKSLVFWRKKRAWKNGKNYHENFLEIGNSKIQNCRLPAFSPLPAVP
jgi:adenine/guanine phosphoribosyltransferase-like PRPP-binding protein